MTYEHFVTDILIASVVSLIIYSPILLMRALLLKKAMKLVKESDETLASARAAIDSLMEERAVLLSENARLREKLEELGLPWKDHANGDSNS